MAIADIRDWFASYVYLPRLRDDATLDDALQQLCTDIALPYAYASSFDDNVGTYEGVVDGKAWLLGDPGDGLLVRREAIQFAAPTPGQAGTGFTPLSAGGAVPTPPEPGGKTQPTKPQPTRFFASIAINPDRAGLEVARIMDGLLVELTRTTGSTLRLTLELEGISTEQGYPEDVVKVVKANAHDLKLDDKSFGFEE